MLSALHNFSQFSTSTSLKLILSKLSNSFPVKTSYDLLWVSECKIWGLVFCPQEWLLVGCCPFQPHWKTCSLWFFLLHESCLLLKILLENSILVAGHFGHWLVVSIGNLLCISLGVPVILDQPIIVCNPSPPSYITCIHLWWQDCFGISLSVQYCIVAECDPKN